MLTLAVQKKNSHLPVFDYVCTYYMYYSYLSKKSYFLKLLAPADFNNQTKLVILK